MVNKAICVACASASPLHVAHIHVCHTRACGLALVLTPTKGREPLPGMAYSAYKECDTLPSLSLLCTIYVHVHSMDRKMMG